MKKYNNKTLSKALNTSLSKWKRWGREFLPPDPNAGMQCGIAREYSMQEAFTVYLGGYLVGNLKYSIPETKTILGDILPWLDKRKMIPGNLVSDEKDWLINIMKGASGFAYKAKGVIEQKIIDQKENIYNEQYVLCLIPGKQSKDIDMLNIKVLHITNLIKSFTGMIG